ncbi:MAG: LPS export ABC transporter ATP-binding protein [Thermodesulfobacteriota bacterium]|nr:LPS export ABC transporter ATP-binding protein [Thermodesulfobacteriota bacterium]
MGEIILKAQDLEKSFGSAHIIKGLSIECHPGEIIGLLGPNGAGKTTTFYMIAGLIRPDKGKITMGNHDITRLDLSGRALKGIGYLPQEASIFRGLSVEQNIMVPLEAKGLNKKEVRQQTEEIIEMFGLDNVRRHIGVSLSGGERRRVEIARAMALDPGVLLLDEPFAGIDPLTIVDLQGMIVDLKKKGISVIITDHNVQETLKICDRAYIIHKGVVIEQGTPEHVVANEKVRQIYVGDTFLLN